MIKARVAKINIIISRFKKIPYRYDLFAFLSLLVLFINSQIYYSRQITVLKPIGLSFLLTACVLWITALVQMKKFGRIPSGKQYYETTILIDQGIFSCVRHPQYLSYILLTSAFMLISQHIAVIIPGAISILCFYFQTLQEEHLLRQRFGDTYDLYCRHVPRFNLIAGLIRYCGKKP